MRASWVRKCDRTYSTDDYAVQSVTKGCVTLSRGSRNVSVLFNRRICFPIVLRKHLAIERVLKFLGSKCRGLSAADNNYILI